MASIFSSLGATLDVPTFLGEDKVPLMYLIPYDKDGVPIKDKKKSFQFWPAEISDSGDPNYSSRNIPGGSVPFYQWVNNADSVISFDVSFSRDLIGEINGTNIEESKYNVDVAAAVAWLKSLKMPVYNQGDIHVEPPYTLKLVTPGMNVWFGGKQYANVIMSQCGVSYKNWMTDPNDNTKSVLVSASVSLAFNQTIQGLRTMKFPGRDGFDEMVSKYTYGG